MRTAIGLKEIIIVIMIEKLQEIIIESSNLNASIHYQKKNNNNTSIPKRYQIGETKITRPI